MSRLGRRAPRGSVVGWLLFVVACGGATERSDSDAVSERVAPGARVTPVATDAVETLPAATSHPIGVDDPGASGHVGVLLARDGVDVAVEVQGRLEDVLVEIGDPVTAGQVLASVATREIEEQLAMARANLRATNAEHREAEVAAGAAARRLNRRRAAPEVFAREETEAVEAEVSKARAMVETLGAHIARDEAEVARHERRLARAVVRAPIAGQVAARRLDRGAFVRDGDVVVRLISPRAALLRFAVAPEAVDQLGVGSRVRFAAASGVTLEGVVSRLAPEVDPASAMVFVEADVGLDGAGSLASKGMRVGTVGTVSSIATPEAVPAS